MAQYLVFLDETGDHNLKQIDMQYPVFALAGCIFELDYYLDVVNPTVDRIKYKYWGHRNVILHSTDIRKQKGPFHILRDATKRQRFFDDINGLITGLNFTIIASGIHKVDHLNQYAYPASPYDLTLEFIMERLVYYFSDTVHECYLIAEARGDKENRDLYAVFQRLVTNGNRYINGSQFSRYIKGIFFYPKNYNENGNQIADLVAYPIGRKIIGRANGYEPYSLVKRKFYRDSRGMFWGYGLKIFPFKTDQRVRSESD